MVWNYFSVQIQTYEDFKDQVTIGIVLSCQIHCCIQVSGFNAMVEDYTRWPAALGRLQQPTWNCLLFGCGLLQSTAVLTKNKFFSYSVWQCGKVRHSSIIIPDVVQCIIKHFFSSSNYKYTSVSVMPAGEECTSAKKLHNIKCCLKPLFKNCSSNSVLHQYLIRALTLRFPLMN